MTQTILIVDFGGATNQLVARQVRDAEVFCRVVPYTKVPALTEEVAGVILTGGPKDVSPDTPQVPEELLNGKVPVLAIGYTMGKLAEQLGGQVERRQDDAAMVPVTFREGPLFSGKGELYVDEAFQVTDVPQGFQGIARENGEVLGMESQEKKIYAVKGKPEHSPAATGRKMLENFLYTICGCERTWTMEKFAEKAVADIREKVGEGKVLLALSGGVDSSVCAKLISEAVGDQLTCIFVNHGFMRKNEPQEVEAAFKDSGMNFIHIDGEDRFLTRLKGVTDPEQKRKIIGEEFIRLFEEEGKKLGQVDFLGQGTIYPDIIESGIGEVEIVKSHHNVGGLPDVIDFKGLVEPLEDLFKDEVRKLGEVLGLDPVLAHRQPFPGPGLGVRCIGELTKEKLDILRDADAIYREEIAAAGWDKKISQYFAILTGNRSVGVRDGKRTYDYTVALRAVNTTDFMTADAVALPMDLLLKIGERIGKEVDGVNRVVYDITNKPPATIEWE